MKKYLLFIALAIFGISISGLFVFSKFHKDQSQIVEIEKEFKKDNAFILDNLYDLPLLLFENKDSKKDYFVILISGDGGWRGFIDDVAKTISENGVSVVGLNLMPYLHEEKSPDTIAKDIQRIIYNFSYTWKKQKVLIGGYSFGGEIIPFFYNKMEAKDQKMVEKIFLIASSNLADFKVSPIYYYNPKKSRPVLPEIENIPAEKFIFFCDNTNESICTILPNSYKTIQFDYDHLFIGHFEEVSDVIAENVVY